MDKNRDKICTPEYKNILDIAFNQLATLEFEGYYLWMHALNLVHLDSSFVVQRYNEAVDRHERFFQSNICQVKIPNSLNFANCSNGYYMYSGLKKDVKCAETYYRTQQLVTLYVFEVLDFSQQPPNEISSAFEIIGSPDVYPNYGNNFKAWSPYKCSDKDFIKVAFKSPLFIENIKIYETYHGGSIWKVEGLDSHGQWKVISERSKSQLQNVESTRTHTINEKLSWSTSILRINIDCTGHGTPTQIDAVEITGRPVEGTCSWYDSFSCTPCGCSSAGSKSSSCSADGICSCKSGFRGPRCLSKDCVVGQWGAWSDCECGPGKTKTRRRSITQRRSGSGRMCGTTSETAACNVKCQCKEGESGDTCQHKDCLVSGWGSWSTCPYQYGSYDCKGNDKRYDTMQRARTITRAKQNNGRPCPYLTEITDCKYPKCFQLATHHYGL